MLFRSVSLSLSLSSGVCLGVFVLTASEWITSLESVVMARVAKPSKLSLKLPSKLNRKKSIEVLQVGRLAPSASFRSFIG